MRPIPVALFAAVLALAAPASAHGDLTVHELETLAIRDFEGQEDSFVWEGFEIWDVYVGDGYDASHDAHGVYFKVNLAGDGSQRPTGGALWTVDFAFAVGDESFQRQITHDGAAVTTTFEALEWTIADGNVFQVKAWAPVPQWEGQAVHDIVIVSSVDGEPRDAAPGGVYLPGTGTEVPVQAPATPIFPPLGEGRVVDSVDLTGPQKYMDVTVTSQGGGVFEFVVKNPLKEQGQHVLLRLPASPSWSVSKTASSAELEGGAATTFQVALEVTATSGVVEPVLLDLYTDIGGRHQYYAYLDGGEVKLSDDAGLAKAATLDAAKEAPSLGLVALVAAVAVALMARRPR